MAIDELLFDLDQISLKYKGKSFDIHAKTNVIDERLELIQQAKIEVDIVQCKLYFDLNKVKCPYYNEKTPEVKYRDGEYTIVEPDEEFQEDFQNLSGTFTTGERQLSVRFDCQNVQRKAA